MKYYAGIGSQITPKDILCDMEMLAVHAAKHNWCLRSGGSHGADMAFETGCIRAGGTKEIFLPWIRFNKNTSPYYISSDEATDLAMILHPKWKMLTTEVQLLITRNVHQIVGQDMKSPVELVICWTPDGTESSSDYSSATSEIGFAIDVANFFKIPVFNLYNPQQFAPALELLTSTQETI